MVEGFSGVSQSYPVFSASGEYLGYTDITYVPDVFLARYIEPATRGTPYDVWVAQAEGTEVYDTTKEEIGKNILTDPAYADPVLHEILVRIAREPRGNATYVFYDKDWKRTITKLAVWDTSGIDGTEWRVVVTKEVGTSAGTSPTTRVTTTASTEERVANLTRFVDAASTYAREHGREKALYEFNNPTGNFTEGELYVFAYEMNGTVIALPYQPALLGTDRSLVSDANGVEFITRMTEIAREGGGYVYYIYPNPVDDYQDEFKISYVLPVDDQWFVGAGVYLPGLPAKFNATDRDALVERVKQARRYAEVQGESGAIAGFNDRNGTFADGNRYIFAYDYNGTTLALPFEPAAIGTDRSNFTDTHGVKITDWEISVARHGGGFVYADYFNPVTGKTGMKLCYVVPVSDHWLVGSGIYSESSP